jgi:hypothetical protein
VVFSRLSEKGIAKSSETNSDEANFSLAVRSDLLLNHAEKDFQETIIKKQYPSHVHALFACNRQGHYSPPLIMFQRNDLLQPNRPNEPWTKTACIAENTMGDELAVFFRWLRLFKLTFNDKKATTILILNTYLHYFLFQNVKEGSDKLLSEFVAYCEEERVFLLFYPVAESQSVMFTRGLFLRFKEEWNVELNKKAAKENPHTQRSFVQTFYQVIRIMFPNKRWDHQKPDDPIHDLVRECFSQMVKTFDFPSELFEKHNFFKSLFSSPPQEAIQSDDSEAAANKSEDIDELDELARIAKPLLTKANVELNGGDKSKKAPAANSSINTHKIGQLNPVEVSERIEWIDSMSEIGSTCIKFTFLKELHNNRSYSCVTKKIKEITAHENHWNSFIKKNKAKFKYDYSFGKNESDYLLRWYDEDIWRMFYHKYCIDKHQISTGESLWTFEILQFPYSVSNNILSAPCKDYTTRPRNFKPRISVIFAFSAAGDYVQPFFVYPENFRTTEAAEDEEAQEEEKSQAQAQSSKASAENVCCFSPHGYVTCRTFETWISKSFLPYIKTKSIEKCILLYCGKLAVIDWKNLKLCSNANINLFAFTSEKQMAFNVLFQKSLRKRQTDLFLDSWRKCTAKLDLSHSLKLKCKTTAQFFALFTDAFQNCIEEIGNRDDQTNSGVNESSVDFQAKMISSFDECKLWPLDKFESDYELFFENAANRLEQIEAQNQKIQESQQQQQQQPAASSSEEDEEENEEDEDGSDTEEISEEEEDEDEDEQEEKSEEEEEESDSQSDKETKPLAKKRKVAAPSPMPNKRKISISDIEKLTPQRSRKSSVSRQESSESKPTVSRRSRSYTKTTKAELQPRVQALNKVIVETNLKQKNNVKLVKKADKTEEEPDTKLLDKSLNDDNEAIYDIVVDDSYLEISENKIFFKNADDEKSKEIIMQNMLELLIREKQKKHTTATTSQHQLNILLEIKSDFDELQNDKKTTERK